MPSAAKSGRRDALERRKAPVVEREVEPRGTVRKGDGARRSTHFDRPRKFVRLDDSAIGGQVSDLWQRCAREWWSL